MSDAQGIRSNHIENNAWNGALLSTSEGRLNLIQLLNDVMLP